MSKPTNYDSSFSLDARVMRSSMICELSGLVNQPGRDLVRLRADLRPAVDTLNLLRDVVETDKIAFSFGQPFFVDESGSNTLWLSFSNVTDENIDKELEHLERLVRAQANETA